jgi:hypothetical protein
MTTLNIVTLSVMAKHCYVSDFMQSVTNEPFMLNVIMLNIFMLNVIMLHVIMLNVIMPNVIMLNAIMRNVIMLNIITLNIFMLNVIMLNVIMLNVIMLYVIMLGVVASYNIINCRTSTVVPSLINERFKKLFVVIMKHFWLSILQKNHLFQVEH